MIILEGMDNSGKSQLAEHLSQMFDLPVVKRIQPPKKDRTAFNLETLAFLSLNPNAIFDRFPVISEAIYGPILRKENALDWESIKWQFYMDKLVSINPLVIYCRPSEPKILSFGARDQMDGVKDTARVLIKGYDVWMEDAADYLTIVKYNFESLIEPVNVELHVKAYLTAEGLL